MGMNSGRVDAIGLDDRMNKASYTSQVKKKNPWENIGAAMTGIGYMLNLPEKFNSAFTVGKRGNQAEGAFLG